ncbi:MAG: winged helix DNA-binding domain-containing protein [Actinomycetota bacterium]
MVLAISDKRVLTQSDLNRALLARQLLLERSTKSISKVLEAMGGLQAQYAPSMYIGLWSRIVGFERDNLTRALERRSVVQGTLLRATIHLVSARDYWPFVAGITETRKQWWLKTHKVATEKEMTAAARKLRKALGSKTMHRSEIDELLGKPMAGGIGLWVPMVRVPPSGTWERRRADLYAAADEWIAPEKVDPIDGVAHLVRSYLRGFGPAPIADIASWAGMRPKQIASALERLRLRRFQGEDGTELLDVPRSPLPAADTAAPVRFLPTWDATLLAHARRTGILPERYRARVFDVKTPHSVPIFTIDGEVAGTWKLEGDRVKINPFERLSRSVARELRNEADALTEFHA